MNEYFRPWKLTTLALGVALLIVGSFYYDVPDWDVPISFVMAILAYVAAPWSLWTLMERRWSRLPAVLFVTWFTVDGSYWLYWRFEAPLTLDAMRSANFPASLTLYALCAVGWSYRGSLEELWRDVVQAFPPATR